MTSDLLTLIKIREGNIEAFENLFREFYSPLLFFSVTITGRGDVSEEIVQELFYQIWKNREKLVILKTIKSYLYGAVKNRSLQYTQRERARNMGESSSVKEIIADRSPDPLHNLEYIELEEIIGKTLKKMPERRVRIFLMHREEDKKYSEIANALSLSVKTVELEISRALKVLRREIEYYIAAL